jgi:hypothetical protein
MIIESATPTAGLVSCNPSCGKLFCDPFSCAPSLLHQNHRIRVILDDSNISLCSLETLHVEPCGIYSVIFPVSSFSVSTMRLE